MMETVGMRNGNEASDCVSVGACVSRVIVSCDLSLLKVFAQGLPFVYYHEN